MPGGRHRPRADEESSPAVGRAARKRDAQGADATPGYVRRVLDVDAVIGADDDFHRPGRFLDERFIDRLFHSGLERFLALILEKEFRNEPEKVVLPRSSGQRGLARGGSRAHDGLRDTLDHPLGARRQLAHHAFGNCWSNRRDECWRQGGKDRQELLVGLFAGLAGVQNRTLHGGSFFRGLPFFETFDSAKIRDGRFFARLCSGPQLVGRRLDELFTSLRRLHAADFFVSHGRFRLKFFTSAGYSGNGGVASHFAERVLALGRAESSCAGLGPLYPRAWSRRGPWRRGAAIDVHVFRDDRSRSGLLAHCRAVLFIRHGPPLCAVPGLGAARYNSSELRTKTRSAGRSVGTFVRTPQKFFQNSIEHDLAVGRMPE